MAELGLGTAQFGFNYGVTNKRGKIPRKEVQEILKEAQKAGVRYLDTAYLYGESEEVLGFFFRKRSNKDFRVITKLPPVTNHKELKEKFFESLKRLNLPKVYGLLWHNFESLKKSLHLWPVIEDLKYEGYVIRIGVSLYYPEELDWLLEKDIKPQIVQVPYNVFDRRFERFFGIGIPDIEFHVRSVFLQGLAFVDPELLSEEFKALKEKLCYLRKLFNLKALKAYLLHFALSRKDISVVLVGVSGIRDFRELLTLVHSRFSPPEDEEILALNDEQVLLPFMWPKNLKFRLMERKSEYFSNMA